MSKLTVRSRLWQSGCVGMVAFALSGCGPQFDPPSKLQSLRILAVKKDNPYLKPPALANSAEYDPSGRYLPENTAHMTLAMEDGRLPEDKQGKIQKLWFAGCNNPVRDNYFGCLFNVWLSFKAFQELGPKPNASEASGSESEALPDGASWTLADVKDAAGNVDLPRIYQFLLNTFPSVSAQMASAGATDAGSQSAASQDLIEQAQSIKIGKGDTFDYTIPPWLIERHAPPAQSTLPRYGLSDVFVAVCDGDINFAPGWETVSDPFAVLTDATRGFPLSCYERGTPTPKERGPDHFMVSYSNLFAYQEITNQNPVISGVTFDGQAVDPSAYCLGEACVPASTSTPNDGDILPPAAETPCGAEPPALIVPRCQASSDDDCKEIEISPVLEPTANSEGDIVASRAGGGDDGLLEQMWIRYYASAGKIKNDAKRLQDATEGWFAEHRTKWTIPRTSGLAHVWAVAYDNRGGVDWVRVSVCVQ